MLDFYWCGRIFDGGDICDSLIGITSANYCIDGNLNTFNAIGILFDGIIECLSLLCFG